jgi:hypothetical protein
MPNQLSLLLMVLVLGTVAASQESYKVPIRVFITDRDAWAESGTAVATKDSAIASFQAGIQRGHTEQVKTLSKSCLRVTITADKASADLVVVWDTKTWQQTSWSGHQNEYAIYNSKGDLMGSGAAHKMTNAAKDICGVLTSPTPKAPKTPVKP